MIRTFRIKGSNGWGFAVVWALIAVAIPYFELTQENPNPADLNLIHTVAGAGFAIFALFTLLAVFFFRRRKEFQVRPDAFVILSPLTGREEVYEFEDLTQIGCEYFEPRTAGSIVWKDTRLILKLDVKNGDPVSLQDDHFSKHDVEELRKAIKTARPGLNVYDRT
jgi:hypothetical protein